MMVFFKLLYSFTPTTSCNQSRTASMSERSIHPLEVLSSMLSKDVIVVYLKPSGYTTVAIWLAESVQTRVFHSSCNVIGWELLNKDMLPHLRPCLRVLIQSACRLSGENQLQCIFIWGFRTKHFNNVCHYPFEDWTSTGFRSVEESGYEVSHLIDAKCTLVWYIWDHWVWEWAFNSTAHDLEFNLNLTVVDVFLHPWGASNDQPCKLMHVHINRMTVLI